MTPDPARATLSWSPGLLTLLTARPMILPLPKVWEQRASNQLTITRSHNGGYRSEEFESLVARC